MANNVIVFDCGNSIAKAKTAGREVAFVSALRELTEADYMRVVERAQGRPGPDYLRVNGKPYVVGESAARHAARLTRRTGAARYEPDYYGVLLAAALSRVYRQSGEVALFASHAPRDLEYRRDLGRAALGTWHVEVDGQERAWRVSYVNTFEEPLGGLMNIVLAEDGQHYQRTDINGASALVIDIGGYTTDWLAVKPGGELDYERADSISAGITDVIRDFERSFRANNREALKGTEALTPEQLREALNTGRLRGGGRVYHCENEATEAANILLNRIADSLQSLVGGLFQFNAIILTGGGSAMLEQPIRRMLGHGNVLLADEPQDLHLANVRGGMKLWRLYEHLGVV